MGDSVDLQDVDEETKEEVWADRGGHTTELNVDHIDYQMHGNVAYDLVKYVRSNTIRNEQQFILVTLGYMTGFFDDVDHYVSGMVIGTSSSGKTHLQKKVEDLFHDDQMYQATTGTDKSLIYDGDWDKAYVASLDELQKPSQTLIEFLKSVHGDDESFVYKLTPDSAEERENENVQTITRLSKPYWFLYAQFDADFEMHNRLLKVPVHESETKNKMVGMLSADHYYIQSGDDEPEYGFDFDEGTEALQAHIQSIPHKVDSGQIPGKVFLPNGDPHAFERSGSGDGGFEWDVWEVVEPVFNHSRSEVNRIYDMVFNLVRASALLNYKNRETRYLDVPNHDEGEYIIAEPQDVANVLSAREALLATTHELDEKKQMICSALETETGMDNEGPMKDIVAGLEKTDMSMLSRPQLREHLEILHENYLVEINRNASEDNTDTYQFMGWDELGFARIPENESLFEDTFDPVSGKNFVEFHEEQRQDLESTGQDLTKGADRSDPTSTTNKRGEWFGGGGRSIDLEEHEEAVRASVEEALDGTRVENLSEVPIEALLGLTDFDDPDRAVDTSDTPLDPTHPCWYQPDKQDDWVETERQARREVKKAVKSLIDKRVILYQDVHETNKSGEPEDVTFAVLSAEDL